MGYLLNIYKDDNKVHESLQKDALDEVVFLEENELVSIMGRTKIILIADALEMSRLETEEYGIIDKGGLLKLKSAFIQEVIQKNGKSVIGYLKKTD